MSSPITDAVTEVVTGQLTGKKWYMSKTFWANVVMAGAAAASGPLGFVISPEIQAVAITGINLALRAVTKQPVVW